MVLAMIAGRKKDRVCADSINKMTALVLVPMISCDVVARAHHVTPEPRLEHYCSLYYSSNWLTINMTSETWKYMDDTLLIFLAAFVGHI